MGHAHTVYGTAFAALGKPLIPMSQDACAFFEDHVVISDEAGKVAVEVKGGNKVANAYKGVKAANHQNHGLLSASRHSIDSAAFWFVALERCCQQQLMIEATGITPKFVPEDRARYSREHVGSGYIGWLHFQTIWNDLIATQPSIGLYGVGFWLPTLIKGSGVKDPLAIRFLTAPPYAAAAISMILVGRSSDARREPRWHVAVPGLIGTAGWIAAVLAGSGIRAVLQEWAASGCASLTACSRIAELTTGLSQHPSTERPD